MVRVALVVLAALFAQAASAQSVIYLCVRKKAVRQVTTPMCVGKEKLATIALIAGPQGPAGEAGPPGSPGPTGPAGPSGDLHLIDGNGADLGQIEFVDLRLVLLSVPTVGAWLPVRMVEGTPFTDGLSIYFETPDCSGTAYIADADLLGISVLRPMGDGSRYWLEGSIGANGIDLIPGSRIRTDFPGACESDEGGFGGTHDVSPLQEVSPVGIPAFPLTPPLTAVSFPWENSPLGG